jgi:hypothetical protein
MASQVLDFLTKLATDPELMTACMKNASGALEKAGLDKDIREALIGGDAYRIHAAITGKEIETDEATERSRANAKLVLDVLSSDPVVAQWLYGYYYQSMQTWRGAAGAGQPILGVAAAPPQMPEAPTAAPGKPIPGAAAPSQTPEVPTAALESEDTSSEKQDG